MGDNVELVSSTCANILKCRIPGILIIIGVRKTINDNYRRANTYLLICWHRLNEPTR